MVLDDEKVEWSPFDETKLACSTAQNFGIIGMLIFDRSFELLTTCITLTMLRPSIHLLLAVVT
jgi:hypothetical protein